MSAYEESEMVCGNCAHWDILNQISVTRHGSYSTITFKAAPCKIDAVEQDAGYDSVTMLGKDGHCRNHAQAWEPSRDFLAERGELDNSVTAGTDYPATMRRVA